MEMDVDSLKEVVAKIQKPLLFISTFIDEMELRSLLFDLDAAISRLGESRDTIKRRLGD